MKIYQEKTNFYLNKFSLAPYPDPSKNDWISWELLLTMQNIENQNDLEESICFVNKKKNYGTRSSSLIAISENFSLKQFKNQIIFLATKQSPLISDFLDVELEY